MSTKICSNKKCEHEGVSQSIDNFDKDKSNCTGVTRWCKSCLKIKREKFLLSRTPEDKARLKKVSAERNKAKLIKEEKARELDKLAFNLGIIK